MTNQKMPKPISEIDWKNQQSELGRVEKPNPGQNFDQVNKAFLITYKGWLTHVTEREDSEMDEFIRTWDSCLNRLPAEKFEAAMEMFITGKVKEYVTFPPTPAQFMAVARAIHVPHETKKLRLQGQTSVRTTRSVGVELRMAQIAKIDPSLLVFKEGQSLKDYMKAQSDALESNNEQ